MKSRPLKWLKETWPGRVYRHWHDNAVFPWQQKRVRSAVDRAFGLPQPLSLHRAIEIGGSWPDAADERPLLFAACDANYYQRFARYLAISGTVRSPATRVHLHVYEPAETCIAEMQQLSDRWPGRLTVSYEPAGRNPYTGPSKFYFAAARFGIAARLRETTRAPIVMVDADGLVVRDLGDAFAEFGDAAAGFIHQSGSVAHYRQILASAIYLGRGTEAEDFFTRLADAIGLALRERGRYHVDQIAIHYALQWCSSHGRQISLRDVDTMWSDSEFAADALIWSTRGPRKARFEELLATFRDLDREG